MNENQLILGKFLSFKVLEEGKQGSKTPLIPIFDLGISHFFENFYFVAILDIDQIGFVTPLDHCALQVISLKKYYLSLIVATAHCPFTPHFRLP